MDLLSALLAICGGNPSPQEAKYGMNFHGGDETLR